MKFGKKCAETQGTFEASMWTFVGTFKVGTLKKFFYPDYDWG